MRAGLSQRVKQVAGTKGKIINYKMKVEAAPAAPFNHLAVAHNHSQNAQLEARRVERAGLLVVQNAAKILFERLQYYEWRESWMRATHHQMACLQPTAVSAHGRQPAVLVLY
jgi:hypothetical protein